MRHVKPSEVEVESAASHAARAFQDAGDDVEKAIKLLESRCQKSSALKMLLLEPMLPRACSDLMWNLVRQRRSVVWSKGSCMTKGASKRIKAHVETCHMTFPLPCGTLLKDATLDAVIAAADLYRKQGEDMCFKSRWLTAVAGKLKGKKKVGDVLTESDLDRLQTESQIP